MLKNIIPKQIKEIPWGWTNETTEEGLCFVKEHPGVVNMPSLQEYFNWTHFQMFDNGPDVPLKHNERVCSCDMKSIFTTYVRFVGFEKAIVEMNQLALSMITDSFIGWNTRLIEAAPYEIDFFFIGDDFAGNINPFIRPSVIESSYLPYLRKLIEAIRVSAPKTKIVFHCCGDIFGLLELFAALPLYAIHYQRVGKMEKVGDCLIGKHSPIRLWENISPWRGTKHE